MRVLKRDKTIEEFQWHKVEHAIAEAFKSCEYENIPYEVIDCMKSKYDENCDDTIDVEDIQDDSFIKALNNSTDEAWNDYEE